MLNNKGFTLCEIIITVSIVSILTAITIPVYSKQKNGIEIDAASSILLQKINSYQQLSINEKSKFKIKFDSSKDIYKIYKNNVLLKTESIPNKVDLEGVNFVYGGQYTDELSFDQSGIPSSGGTIYLKSKDNRRKLITVLPCTGRTIIK